MGAWKSAVMLAGAAMLAVRSSGAVRADLLYDNLTIPGATGESSVRGNEPIADSFSTGTSGFAFSDLKLVLGIFAPPGARPPRAC